ncbi:MAG: ferredoxin [Bacteroidales bacterium]|jgi:ferredoxin
MKKVFILVLITSLPVMGIAFFAGINQHHQSAVIDQGSCISCGACYDGWQEYWVFTESGNDGKANWVHCNGSSGDLKFFINFDEKYRLTILEGLEVCPTNSIFFIN